MLRALALALSVTLSPVPWLAPADAATVRLVADPTRVTPLVRVNPGIYGVEVRGGRQGARGDWELGVGTQTSVNRPSFATGQIAWPVLPGMLDYRLTWSAGRVEMTVGPTTVGWNAAWAVGNAVTVSLKAGSGDTRFTIDALDGVAVNWQAVVTNGPMRHFTFWGPRLADGWTMTGRIGMTPEGGSNRGVMITAAHYAAPVPLPAAGGLLLAGLGGLGLAARRRPAA